MLLGHVKPKRTREEDFCPIRQGRQTRVAGGMLVENREPEREGEDTDGREGLLLACRVRAGVCGGAVGGVSRAYVSDGIVIFFNRNGWEEKLVMWGDTVDGYGAPKCKPVRYKNIDFDEVLFVFFFLPCMTDGRGSYKD